MKKNESKNEKGNTAPGKHSSSQIGSSTSKRPIATRPASLTVKGEPPKNSSAFEEKLRPNWIDGLLTGLCPVLIGGMICCLVFFLITIIYSGNFTIRLMYILGLYTCASVLTARIAIEQTRAIAMTYSAILGVATLFVSLKFVQFPGAFAPFAIPSMIGFLLLIAFLADRITYDCTLIDDAADGSSEGLLQSLGLVSGLFNSSERKNPSIPTNSQSVQQESNTVANARENEISTKRKIKEKKHNPGVWLLYFALLAIPLFGLGQVTIPAWDRSRNQLAFLFLIGYLYCTLSLLVITSLLGLRRYLRKRRVEMPFELAATWLFSALAGIVVLLAGLSFITFPAAPTGLFEVPFKITTSENVATNKSEMGIGGIQEKNEKENSDNLPKEKVKQPSAQSAEKQPTKSPNEDDNGGAEKKPKESTDGKEGKGADSKEGKGTDSKEGKGTQKKESNDSDSNNQVETKNPENPKSESDSNKAEGNIAKDKAEQKKSSDENKKLKKDSSLPPNDVKSKDDKPKPPDPQQKPPPQNLKTEAPPQPSSWNISLTGSLWDLFRWLLVVALALFILVCLVLYRSSVWRSINQLLASFFNLFSNSNDESPEAAQDQPDNQGKTKNKRRLFSEFANPFHSNQTQWTPIKIVSHTFEALEAWGTERGIPKKLGETAEEYLVRLCIRFPDQTESFQRLTNLYNRLAYASGSVAKSECSKLSNLWNWLSS